MASKTTKRARQAAEQHPAEKDDGSRWQVRFANNHPTEWLRGHLAYLGESVQNKEQGVSKKEARRLAEGLHGPTELVCVKEA